MRVFLEEERKWMLLETINISVSAGGCACGISAICAAFVGFRQCFFTTVCKNT